MPKSQLKTKNWVVKSNELNEMKTHGMTLQELRLFSVYLSKINPREKNTRNVRFSLTDFIAIMEFRNPNISYFKNVAKNLLSKVIFEPLESGGFDAFTIFNRFKMSSKDGEWYIDVDANEAALPLLFDFQGRYFKYELWNALRLKSTNQLRMYEFLKQFEKIGYKVIQVEELKWWLGIGENEYNQYYSLKRDVLEVCRKALDEYTDISYTYEPHGKKGRGGKVLQLKFTITKNKGHTDHLNLGKFIDLNNKNIIEGEHEEEIKYIKCHTNSNLTQNSKIDLNDLDENGNVRSTGTLPSYEERIDYLMTACNNEFSREEIVLLYSIMQKKVPFIHSDEHRSHDYLQHKYREMEMNNKKSKVIHRFAYFRSLIEKEKG